MTELVYRDPVEGEPFGRYLLIEVLGRGGMGEVWRAHDTVIDREVALKVLLPHFATDPEFNERFRREARAAAQLDDPHVVPIYDVGEHDGRLYVTMQLIDGVDLQTLLNAGPLEPARAVRIVEQVASALHCAHRAGLVHRDVKPSNILLTGRDFAYLIDFGIARSASDTGLTSAHTAIGTWAYMAPERFGSADIAATSDVYALTCVLYQCLTGGVPYPGDTLEQVAGGHLVTPPPRPSLESPTVPISMDRVVATGLAKNPAQRYPGTVELAHAARDALTAPFAHPDPAYALPYAAPSPAPLDQPTEPDRPRRRRGVLMGAVAVVAVLIAVGVFAAARMTRDAPAPVAIPTATSTTPPAPLPNTGPLTGIYRAEFGPITGLNDAPGPDRFHPTDTFAIRSACRPTGCVATAARLEGGTAFAKPVVLDQVGDRWIAVGLSAVPCKADPATESWEVLTVQPRPDGTLTGEYTATTSNDCVAKRTVTLTRTGDVDLDSLPNPEALPPRVVSPAEALRGEYHHVRRFPAYGQQQDVDYRVRTDCLRTAERCMSFLHGKAGEVLPLVLTDGAWNLFSVTEGACRGAPMTVTKSGRYPLPQAPQNPLPTLTGSGRQDQTGACAANAEFDDTFTRTGE